MTVFRPRFARCDEYQRARARALWIFRDIVAATTAGPSTPGPSAAEVVSVIERHAAWCVDRPGRRRRALRECAKHIGGGGDGTCAASPSRRLASRPLHGLSHHSKLHDRLRDLDLDRAFRQPPAGREEAAGGAPPARRLAVDHPTSRSVNEVPAPQLPRNRILSEGIMLCYLPTDPTLRPDSSPSDEAIRATPREGTHSVILPSAVTQRALLGWRAFASCRADISSSGEPTPTCSPWVGSHVAASGQPFLTSCAWPATS